MKLKSFSKVKDTINRTGWLPTEWEKIFINSTYDRGLITKTYKELKKLDINKPDNPIQNWEYSSQKSVVDYLAV